MRPIVRSAALPRPLARPWTVPRAGARVAVVIGVGALVAGLVFLYLWQGCTLTILNTERARLLLSLSELERERDLLSFQVAQAYSPEALAERATKLGMEPFSEDRTSYLILEDDEKPGH